MWILLLLPLISAPRVSAIPVKGFHYNDNKGKYGWQEGNGMVAFKSDSFLPASMTVCMRAKSLYSRHGDQMYWFNVIIRKDRPRVDTFPIDFAFYSRSRGEWRVITASISPLVRIVMNKEEMDAAKLADSWPSKNSLRKWLHFCVGGDFKNDRTVPYINGQKVNETEFKFSESFSDNYYSEALRILILIYYALMALCCPGSQLNLVDTCTTAPQ
jgi:hypothetical protein